jgi:hypothetical protein
MPRWRANGYQIVQWAGDHDPPHVHVYRDQRLVAKFNLQAQVFMMVDERHRTRVLAALRQVGLA